MHITTIATDFDGTISAGEHLAAEARRSLQRWREKGRFVVLVSGRPFSFLHALQEREQLFDLIVAENGAVLYNPRKDEMYLPFGDVPTDLLDMLSRAGVPLWRGAAIAGTTMPYDDAVWVASREMGLAVHVEINRKEVMLLPPGASKGAGLRHLLKTEGLSPRNVLAFGDAENDRSMLEIAEVKVAVANAIGSIQALADHVTAEAGAPGVSGFIERYLLDERPFDFPVRGAHHFPFDAAAQVNLNAYELVNRHILIAGGSGYGKSWLAGRLADGLIHGEYQVLGLDPVGDLGVLRRHATCLCLGREEVPPINLLIELLAETDLSLIVDLSRFSAPEERVLYVAGLLRRVTEVRRRYGKPHWLVADEAQDLFGGPDNPASKFFCSEPALPGAALVAWRPSQLSPGVLDRMDGFLLTRHTLEQETSVLERALAGRGLAVDGLAGRLAALEEGQALAWGLSSWQAETSPPLTVPLRFQIGPRSFPQMHRLHRYVEQRVLPARQFYFHAAPEPVPPAGNLGDLIDRLRTLPPAVIAYHFERGDFTRWIRDVLRDEALARWLDRLQTVGLSGEPLRAALLEVLEHRQRWLSRLF